MYDARESSVSGPKARSLFARIGGEEAVQSAVVDFYARIMCDPRLEPFFEHIDMSAQIQKQIAFMTMAFDGPHDYTGRSMTDAHARLVEMGMNDEHFDLVVGHLSATLRELGIEAEAAREALAIVEATRDDVFGRVR